MKIEINHQSLTLKFGFGFLRKLGEKYDLEGYNSVMLFLKKELSDLKELTFKQEDILVDVIKCSADNHSPITKAQENAFNGFSMVEYVISNQGVIEEIFENIQKSLPQDQGKQKANPTVRKSTRAKK